MTPAERYRTDPNFAEQVDRLAGHCAVSVGEVLHELTRLDLATRPALPTPADLAAAFAQERRSVVPARSGPPVPRWARQRRRWRQGS